MQIIDDVFQMEEKERKHQERLKMCQKNPCQSEESALAWDRQLCLGQWQEQREVRGSLRNSAREKGEHKEE